MFSFQQHADISIVKLQGELGLKEATYLKQILIPFLAYRSKRLILDFQAVEHIHYLGAGVLLKQIQVLKKRQAQLELVRMSPYNQQIFNLVGGPLSEALNTTAPLSLQRTLH